MVVLGHVVCGMMWSSTSGTESFFMGVGDRLTSLSLNFLIIKDFCRGGRMRVKES